jgi:hypothetical protein
MHRTATRLDPGNLQLRETLVGVYLAKGDCTHALPHLKDVHRWYPNHKEPALALEACERQR